LAGMQDLDTGSILVIRLEKLSEMPVDLWKANAPAQDSAPPPEASLFLTMEGQLEGQEVPVAQQEGNHQEDQLMVAQLVVQQEDRQVEEQQSTRQLAEEALLTFQLSR